MTSNDRRFLKQIRDRYESDLKRLQENQRQQTQQFQVAEHEIRRGLTHIDSILSLADEDTAVEAPASLASA